MFFYFANFVQYQGSFVEGGDVVLRDDPLRHSPGPCSTCLQNKVRIRQVSGDGQKNTMALVGPLQPEWVARLFLDLIRGYALLV